MESENQDSQIPDTNYAEELVNEFKNKFGSHPVRVKRFALTQQDKIETETKLILASDKYNFTREYATFYAHIYQFILSEGLFRAPLSVLIEDLQIYAKFFNKTIEPPFDELIDTVITYYIQSIQFLNDIYYELSKYLIQKRAQDWKEDLLRSYALNDYFKPILKILLEKFPSLPVRFITAIAWTFLQRFVAKNPFKDKDKLESIYLNKYYKEIEKEYPDLDGDVYIYDLAFKFLLKPNWEILNEMIKDEVERLKAEFEQQKEIMRKETKDRKAAEGRRISQTDTYKNQISVRIFELFKFDQELDEKKENLIIKVFSGLMRRVVVEKWTHVAIEPQHVDEFKKDIFDFIYSEIVEYPFFFAKAYAFTPKSKFYMPNVIHKPMDEILAEFKEDPKLALQYKDVFREELFKGFTGGADFDLISKNFIEILKKSKRTE
ncbi:MAG: hypothetical protein HeimC3_21740 [Candidatus Heimdallarchaeota archaeon LC_3]|nr:MAG: hypothetical protein HeimC3_21740 [Candidatus Heimdallarchaeota archaeon LC_3]